MKLTIRLKDERYIDVELDTINRELTILSPIPDIEKETLYTLSKEFRYTINLPITKLIIIPKDKTPDYEYEISEDLDTLDILSLILLFSNYIVLEEK